MLKSKWNWKKKRPKIANSASAKLEAELAKKKNKELFMKLWL